MKSLSLLKKTALSFNFGILPIKLILTIYPIWNILTLIDKNTPLSDQLYDIIISPGYGFLVCFYFMIDLSNIFSQKRFIKTLPLKENDFINILIIDALVSIVFILEGQLAVMFCISDFSYILQFLCLDCFFLASFSILIPIYLKHDITFNMLNVIGDARDKELKISNRPVKAFIFFIIYNIISSVITSLVIKLIFDFHNEETYMPMLIIISAVSILVTAVSFVISKKSKACLEC